MLVVGFFFFQIQIIPHTLILLLSGETFLTDILTLNGKKECLDIYKDIIHYVVLLVVKKHIISSISICIKYFHWPWKRICSVFCSVMLYNTLISCPQLSPFHAGITENLLKAQCGTLEHLQGCITVQWKINLHFIYRVSQNMNCLSFHLLIKKQKKTKHFYWHKNQSHFQGGSLHLQVSAVVQKVDLSGVTWSWSQLVV